MGRRPKAKRYSILVADAVCCVGPDRNFDLEAEDDPENNLMDQLQCPVADEVLIALRKSFSLTYPRNPFIDGIQSSIAEIRKICVEAMKPMPEVLSDLGLPAIPTITDDPAANKTRILQFVFARTADVDITVKVSGKKRRLLDVAGNQDATELLLTLRHVISDTFGEAFDEDQHQAILRRIRERIQAVLPDFNACLQSIEIEPIWKPVPAAAAEEAPVKSE